MCSPRGRRRVPARSYSFRARLGSVRITQWEVLFRGVSPSKERKADPAKRIGFGIPDYYFLWITFRLLKTLTQFAEFFGTDRQVSVSREISKLHEETVRGSLEEVIQHFTVNEPRGEIVIVLAGLKDKKDKETEKDV